MSELVLFNKPFEVLSQFTDPGGRRCLADYLHSADLSGFYPAGRLDFDSEGLLLLTNDGRLQHRIAHPDQKLPKTYWVQVEGIAAPAQIAQLERGVELNDGLSKPARARMLDEPQLWPRSPPVRFRQSVPTQWLEITLTEGRNRQVRRMTAAVGLPTLRLVRVRIGPWQLDGLAPGDYRLQAVNLPSSPPLNTRKTQPTKRHKRKS